MAHRNPFAGLRGLNEIRPQRTLQATHRDGGREQEKVTQTCLNKNRKRSHIITLFHWGLNTELWKFPL